MSERKSDCGTFLSLFPFVNQYLWHVLLSADAHIQVSLPHASHSLCVCVCLVCNISTAVCEVLSDSPCSILSRCVSALVAFPFPSRRLPLPPLSLQRSPPSFLQRRRRLIDISVEVFLSVFFSFLSLD